AGRLWLEIIQINIRAVVRRGADLGLRLIYADHEAAPTVKPEARYTAIEFRCARPHHLPLVRVLADQFDRRREVAPIGDDVFTERPGFRRVKLTAPVRRELWQPARQVQLPVREAEIANVIHVALRDWAGLHAEAERKRCFTLGRQRVAQVDLQAWPGQVIL